MILPNTVSNFYYDIAQRYAHFQPAKPDFRSSNFSFIFATIRNALAAFGLRRFSALRISARKREFDGIGTEWRKRALESGEL